MKSSRDHLRICSFDDQSCRAASWASATREVIPELVVHMRQVRLHRAMGNEEPRGDVLVAKSFADQPHDVELGRRQGRPSGRRPLPLAMTALCIGDRLLKRQCCSFGPGGIELVAQLIAYFRDRRRISRFVKLEANRTRSLPNRLRCTGKSRASRWLAAHDRRFRQGSLARPERSDSPRPRPP